MKAPFLSGDEPLRLALVLMLVALLLPLAVVIWLLLKNVNAERGAVRAELIAAYQQQIQTLVNERGEDWNRYLDRLPARDASSRAFASWMWEGRVDAIMYLDGSGRLVYPAVAETTDLRAAPAAEEPVFLPRFRRAVTIWAQSDASEPSRTAAQAEIEAILPQALLAASADETSQDSLWRWLLRLTETSTANAPWFEELRAYWIIVFQSGDGGNPPYSWRERGFLARRLLTYEPLVEGSPTLRAALSQAAQRYRLQEGLLSSYFQQTWSNAEPLDRWMVLVRPEQEIDGDTVVTIIRRSIGSTLVMQIRESVLAERIAPVWKQPALPAHLWACVKSNRGRVFGTRPTSDAEAFATLELPNPFYGWIIEIGFTDEAFLTKTSRRQTTVSVVAGTMLVLLILVVGVLALRQINRQIHLNRLKNDFIGLVSHELRTPLASMRMLVETLLEGRYRDEATLREYLELVAGENKRLSRLVENFLTFSRMQRGKSQLQMETVRMESVLKAALTATKPHMEAPGVRFTKQIDATLPPLKGNEDALVTVIINLLENAYKYTLEDKRIELRVKAEPEGICIEVSDNGIGIPAREQKQIFREFYQVDNRLARRSEGSGLGLSINQHIVRAHGGRISVESVPGHGSTFRVRLPAAAPSAPDQTVAAERRKETTLLRG